MLPEVVARIIERERPDALLPTLGGQTALNLAKALHDDGTLKKFDVELIGADYEAIHRAEDRDAFRETMEGAGLRVPWSMIAESVGDAEKSLADGGVTLPAIVRPAFTMGGQGGGVAYTETELRQVVSEGLAASPINQVLVEESVIGWGEFELELMRDRNDNVIVICSIENIDAMGVHTGDSVTVAPAQSLSDSLYQELRDQALAVIRAVGVETGGSNVQFGVNPETGEIVVIEMNPRVSRSSALASKATGFPIAKIAAPPRGRYTLDEIPNDITKATPRPSSRPSTTSSRRSRARLREVPRQRRQPDHTHEVGRRGDGHRPDLPGVLRQGHALARARLRGGSRRDRRGAAQTARDAIVGSLRPRPRGLPSRGLGGDGERPDDDRLLVPQRARGARYER